MQHIKDGVGSSQYPTSVIFFYFLLADINALCGCQNHFYGLGTSISNATERLELTIKKNDERLSLLHKPPGVVFCDIHHTSPPTDVTFNINFPTMANKCFVCSRNPGSLFLTWYHFICLRVQRTRDDYYIDVQIVNLCQRWMWKVGTHLV